jgi:SpoVK/Ycf46/Vps4 family AAA+-type ATPase
MISKSPLLSLKVISTFPEKTPVFLSSASQVVFTTASNSVITNTSDPVLQLEQSFESMSLSSLQKAYNALYEVVCFPFLYKDWIAKLNIECPKGVLLYGPPGVGKTFLVSSMAKRCNAKMFIIQGPEVFGPFIGESEEKLRAKFTEAREYAIKENVPVILFIDEIVRVFQLQNAERESINMCIIGRFNSTSR